MPEARVVTVVGAARAERHVAAWRRLQRRALEPNLFLDPDFLLPLIRHCRNDRPHLLAFAYGPDDEMIGCAAFSDTASLGTLGPTLLPTWEHPYSLDATPLLHSDRPEAAAAALVDWLDRSDHPWSMVGWNGVSLESRTWAHVEDAVRERGRRSWTRRSFRRPEHRVRGSFEDYLAELSSKRRGKLRWRMNRVEKEGDLEIVLQRDLEDPNVLDRFLELEAAGWKGEAGTALACDPDDEAFFRETSERLAADRRLFFVELTLDRRPLAISANYRDGDTLFLFKSAYDPERGKLSPGIVNLIHLTRLAHEEPGVERLDSCAGDDSHLEQVWEEGFPFGDVLTATGALSDLVVSSLPWLRDSRDLVARTVGRAESGGT